MRDFKGMKRQRGRNRNGGGGGGNKPQQHNANRAFDSNGPEGIKVRGNAQHVFEKYQQLARDAATGGDRVLAENYLQHAEHYFRVIRAVTPSRAPADIIGRDAFQSGYDIDFEDESGAQAFHDAEAENQQNNGQQAQPEGEGQRQDYQARQDAPRQDYQRQDGQRQDGQRQDVQREGQQPRRDDRNRDRFEGRQRDDRPRDDRPRDDRPRDDRPREDRPRDDRPRDDRPREDRPRDDRPREDRPREDRPRFRDRPREDRDPLPVVEPAATPLPIAADASSPVLRSADGDASHAPDFLKPRARTAAPAVSTEEAAEAPKPKRRRAPKTFESGEPATEETS